MNKSEIYKLLKRNNELYVKLDKEVKFLQKTSNKTYNQIFGERVMRGSVWGFLFSLAII